MILRLQLPSSAVESQAETRDLSVACQVPIPLTDTVDTSFWPTQRVTVESASVGTKGGNILVSQHIVLGRVERNTVKSNLPQKLANALLTAGQRRLLAVLTVSFFIAASVGLWLAGLHSNGQASALPMPVAQMQKGKPLTKAELIVPAALTKPAEEQKATAKRAARRRSPVYLKMLEKRF